jgi:hypothetical protein
MKLPTAQLAMPCGLHVTKTRLSFILHIKFAAVTQMNLGLCRTAHVSENVRYSLQTWSTIKTGCKQQGIKDWKNKLHLAILVLLTEQGDDSEHFTGTPHNHLWLGSLCARARTDSIAHNERVRGEGVGRPWSCSSAGDRGKRGSVGGGGEEDKDALVGPSYREVSFWDRTEEPTYAHDNVSSLIRHADL